MDTQRFASIGETLAVPLEITPGNLFMRFNHLFCRQPADRFRLAWVVTLLSFASLTFAGQEPDGGDAASMLGQCPDGNIELATRADITITLADFDAWMSRIPAHDRPGFVQSNERIQARIMELLRQRGLAQQARDSGFKPGQGLVNEIRAMIDHERNARDFASLPLSDCEQQVEWVGIAHERIVAERMTSTPFTDSLVKERLPADFSTLASERFRASPARYNAPEQRDIRYLYISSVERGADAAYARAEELIRRTVEDGEDFASLVQDFSESPLLDDDGGVVRDVVYATAPDEAKEAVFSIAAPGDVFSQPVVTADGFFVIQLLALTPERQLSPDEALPQIENELRDAFVQQLRTDIFNQFNTIPIEADERVLLHLRERYPLVEVDEQGALLH